MKCKYKLYIETISYYTVIHSTFWKYAFPKVTNILAMCNFLRWLAKYCLECKLVEILFRYR